MQTSIINYQKTCEYNDFRIDSEFFAEEFIKTIKKIESRGFVFCEQICVIRSGTTPKDRNEHLTDGIVLLKTNNIRDSILVTDSEGTFSYIDDAIDKRMARTRLQSQDVLINIVGATTDVIGRTAFIATDFPKANITQAMAFCRLKTSEFLPHYLFAFLKTYYGKVQVKYIARPTGQYNLNLKEVGFLRVPKLTLEFQKKIKELILKSENHKKAAIDCYIQAKNLLVVELNLMVWEPKHDLSFIKNYNAAKQAKRIDAEYFQPKYEKIENIIKSYKGGYSWIKDEFKQNKSTFVIDRKKTYKYIEIGSINVSSGEILADEILGSELPANAKRVLKKDDIIVSKVRTYRGAITIVDQEGYIGSGAFTVLQEQGRINKETLLAFLHSKPLLEWSLKPNTGTSYPVIIDDDILNLPIPLIKDEIQKKIQQKMYESFNLRVQSKHLLECAKKAVEMAIEKDEQTAMKWLSEQAGI
ncbi:MAG: Type I restriction modification DNA specificity domain protein [Elusimicrobia bacterium ADurb.Bin231]|nr:MAG: Type I restriction modification DNA specificity domain protein [Elusimicrobia bacterium ADurb.Bin231]